MTIRSTRCLLGAGVGAIIGLSGCSDATLSGTSCSLASFAPNPTSGMSLGIASTVLGGPTVAQAFVPATAGTAVYATAMLQRVGTFAVGSQFLTATLEGTATNGSGQSIPNSTAVATSETMDVSNISANTPTLYKFTFTASVGLNAGQTYWLRIRASYGVNSTNYVNWLAYDGKSGGYFSGTTSLGAVYESATGLTNANIGQFRYLVFNIGC